MLLRESISQGCRWTSTEKKFHQKVAWDEVFKQLNMEIMQNVKFTNIHVIDFAGMLCPYCGKNGACCGF